MIDFAMSPGYNSTGFFEGSNVVAIPGTGGRIMAVWWVQVVLSCPRLTDSWFRTCIPIAMFQFMGGEIVLVTAAEAESPRRVLPTAAR